MFELYCSFAVNIKGGRFPLRKLSPTKISVGATIKSLTRVVQTLFRPHKEKRKKQSGHARLDQSVALMVTKVTITTDRWRNATTQQSDSRDSLKVVPTCFSGLKI